MPESVAQEVQKSNTPKVEVLKEHYPGYERPAQEAWEHFVDSVAAKSKASAPAKHEVDPRGRSKEEVEFFKAVGEKKKPGSDEEKGAESATKNSETNATKTEREGEGKQAAKSETQKSQNQQQTGYDRLLERASKEPDFEKVVERLHEPFFPQSREGFARYQVLDHALKETINAPDVIYFLARPENSSIALKMQDATPAQIAKTVHMISAELRFGGRTAKRAQEEPRPRAPKPPAEVGGRGAVMGDAAKQAAQEGNFSAFEKEMNKRAAASRR